MGVQDGMSYLSTEEGQGPGTHRHGRSSYGGLPVASAWSLFLGQAVSISVKALAGVT